MIHRKRLALESLDERLTPTGLPGGFVESLVATGLTSPTSLEELPDGRLLVTEQTGSLRIIQNDTLVAAPAISLTVDSAGERGLLGITHDPSFANNGYIYAYYTMPASGTASPFNRVSRFTVTGNTIDPTSEFVLVNLDPLSAATNHNGGALHFGNDGKLYVAVGENATPSNAQSLNNRLGKILRYNADGSIPTDNPTTIAGISGTTSGANRAIYAAGLRNPFTFDFGTSGNTLYVNDVGQQAFEEINDVAAGQNYGWPGTEGDFNAAAFPNFTRPIYSYAHGTGAGQGFAITGGTFYNPIAARFPADYVGDYYFADFVTDFISRYDPSTKTVTPFATSVDAGGIVDLDDTANGDLLYLSRGSGGVGAGVYRIRYSEPPQILQEPQSQTILVGQSTTFSVTATGTPPPTYQWRRNGVDIPGANATSYTLSNAQLADHGAKFNVVILNEAGSRTSGDATLSVFTNQPPVATIDAPTEPMNGSPLFLAGQPIPFQGHATDPNDGELPASAFRWRLEATGRFDDQGRLDSSSALARTVVLDTADGVREGTLTIPTEFGRGGTDFDIALAIVVEVQDHDGNTQSARVSLIPPRGTISANANIAGVPFQLNGRPLQDYGKVFSTGVYFRPATAETISPTMASFIRNGVTYTFDRWDDGVRDLARPVVPDLTTEYQTTVVRAIYKPNPQATFAVGGPGEARLVDGQIRTRISQSLANVPGADSYRAALGDLNGDLVPELIVGAAPGQPPTVKIYDGIGGQQLYNWTVFEPTFTGGVFVTTLQRKGGNLAVVVSADQGGGARIRTLELQGVNVQEPYVRSDFLGIDDPFFRGGARVAVADINADGQDDYIISAGFLGGPRVSVVDGQAEPIANRFPRLFNDFFAFEQSLRNGSFVAGGDIDGDGFADIIAGGGPSGAPRVVAYSGKSLLNNHLQIVANFFAADANDRSGIRLAARDIDNDGQVELLTGNGPGTRSRVQVYRLADLRNANPTPTQTFSPFGDDLNGVFVG